MDAVCRPRRPARAGDCRGADASPASGLALAPRAGHWRELALRAGHWRELALRAGHWRELAVRAGAACLLLLACNVERGRSEPAASVQLRQARPAAGAAQQPAPSGSSGSAAPIASASDAPPTWPSGAPATPPQAAPRQRPRPERRPLELLPGANEDFDPGVVADVEYALGATNENAFATLVHEKKHVTPTNCRDWRIFRRRGYAPKSSKNALAEHVDAGALVRCSALEFLARAAPSRVSYVRDALRGAGPAQLPAIVASATSKPALQARTAAQSRGLSLGELSPSARLGTSELPGRVTIIEPSSQTSVILNAEVWGDINADGVEDLLISVLNTEDEGAYFDMRLLEVTRTSRNARLKVLAVVR